MFNVTKEAVVTRQAKVTDQLPPIPGVPSVDYKPVQQKPPAWWAEAITGRLSPGIRFMQRHKESAPWK